MRKNIVRPIAICVFRHNGHILAAEGFDPIKQQRFYRPLGGTIEFGETSDETIVRELREELGVEVAGLRALGTLENIFIYGGEMGHEIVLVYDGAFVDPAVYKRPWLDAAEDDGQPFRAVWLSLEAARRPGHPPVYPRGLLELLDAAPAR